jgi:lipoprotein NlpD
MRSPRRTTAARPVLRLIAVALVACFMLGGCASNASRKAPQTYTVKRGDTLYSIALRYGLDYRDVARWNGIGRGYVIYPGQKLKLYPSSPQSRSAAARKPSTTQPAKTGKASAPSAGTRSGTKPTPARAPAGPPMKWQWPVTGGTPTLTSRPNGGYGLTISGRLGDEVRAAEAGRVVYTGSGLLGYGQLVIVKHNDTYLSAYGHTQAVVVREGDQVRAGQRIATMGAGPQGAPMLYFEIRINGEPHNPLQFLPPR